MQQLKKKTMPAFVIVEFDIKANKIGILYTESTTPSVDVLPIQSLKEWVH